MSKTLAQFAQLLSASNEQLFDRYVNVMLCRDRPVAGGVSGEGDFTIRTPLNGIKPSITISGKIQADMTINLITMTIYNMSANIDTMAYNWAMVEVGYLNSGVHTTFIGQITNCYMAKPNPNGELVVSIVNANVTALYAQGAFEVSFPSEIVTTDQLILLCLNKIASEYPELRPHMTDVLLTMPLEWKTQEFAVGKATRHFRSPLECIAWLNSLFASFVYDTRYDIDAGGAPSSRVGLTSKLAPLRLGFDAIGTLRCTCSYSESSPTLLRSLAGISSAFLTSTDSATVTAPFNPSITPGEIVYIDARYFRTRLNLDIMRQKYAQKGNMWYVVEIDFAFSTQTTNTMTLKLVNTAIELAASEG